MSNWMEKSGELASASGREFERQVLPLLQARWQDLVRPREIKGLDKHGIDLVVWDDSLAFPCVVQCKGLYQEEKLITAQLPQVLRSIAAFLRSPYRCRDYVLVHNRTGEDRDAHEAIEAALKSLIDAGKADNTFLWDRQKLIRESKEVLKRIIADRVSKRAADRLEQQRRFFLFGDVFVEKVPAKRTAWRFTALQNAQATERQPEPVDLAQIIKSVKKRKWTLLIGDFGIGKSTMALQSASSVGSNLLYARADELPNVERSIGTNYLMQNVLRSLELFPKLDDKSAEELERLSGTLLRKLLCNPETGMVLVIDGLDESPTYSSARGLVQLTNELEEIRSPIVLVTRKEHFDATYGNFESLMEHATRDLLSTKRGKKREATILELLAWSPVEVERFLEQCLSQCPDEGREGVARLLAAQRSGQLEEIFRGLHAHPLFLQMLVEVGVEDGELPANPALLIWEWTKRKIERDLRSGRSTPWPVRDVGVFVAEMLQLMAGVAGATLDEKGGTPFLTESLPEGVVLSFVPEQYRAAADISDIVSTSLLVPASRRMPSGTPIRFYHRVLQEFFLAVHLKTRGLEPPLPVEVRFWFDELEGVPLQ